MNYCGVSHTSILSGYVIDSCTVGYDDYLLKTYDYTVDWSALIGWKNAGDISVFSPRVLIKPRSEHSSIDMQMSPPYWNS